VKEITSYAGETVEITRTIIKGSAEDAKRRAASSKDNLSALVASLQAKKSINTLDMSRVSWDISKAEEGDADVLAQKSRNGYVEKMNFLAATDQRIFEREKEERNRKRRMAEREKMAAQGGAGSGNAAAHGDHDHYDQNDDDEEEDAGVAEAEGKEAAAANP